MNDNPYPDFVLVILEATFLKVRPLPPECLLEHEKIWVNPCFIKLDSFCEEESRCENRNEHIKVTFPILGGYTTWFIEKKYCRVKKFNSPLCGFYSPPSQTVKDFEEIIKNHKKNTS